MKYKFRRSPKSYVAMEAARLNPIFTAQCGLKSRPTVTFSREIVRDLVPRYGYGLSRVKRSKYRGLSYIRANLIWLNPNLDTEQCRKTLAHEFIHLRFPYLGHGSKFESHIKRLLDGDQFRPYAPRKEKAAA